jgi:hypothetical protein
VTDKYFNENGLLGPHGENDVVFTAQYYTLVLLASNGSPLVRENLRGKLTAAIDSLLASPKHFASSAEGQPWSHDNHSALISVSQIYGLKYHTTFFYKYWWRRVHPRDLIFYIHSLGGIWRLLALPFIPLLSLIMILGAFPKYKNIDGQLVLATDGKLLSWLRLHTGNFPLTKRVYDYIIRVNYGSWTTIFGTYFRDVNHPNNIYARKIYKSGEGHQ